MHSRQHIYPVHDPDPNCPRMKKLREHGPDDLAGANHPELPILRKVWDSAQANDAAYHRMIRDLGASPEFWQRQWQEGEAILEKRLKRIKGIRWD